MSASTNDKAEAEPEEILGGLENIRELLDEDEQSAEPPIVSEAHVESESVPDPADPTESHKLTEVQDDWVQALSATIADSLDEAIGKTLEDNRQSIATNAAAWTPEATDELNAALRVRIDSLVQQWLQQVVRSNITELRTSLAEVVSREVHHALSRQLDLMNRMLDANSKLSRHSE